MANQIDIDCFVGLFVWHKEVSAKEYKRVPVKWNFNASKFRLYNSAAYFPKAKGSWGAITHYALFHTKTGKKRYTKVEKLTASAPSIKAGENYCFPRGELLINFELIEK